MVDLRVITFEEVYPIWDKNLWNGRLSEIKSMSSMMFLEGYDMTIYSKYIPKFWGLYDENLIGVNSGFQSSEFEYRSRGLWINKNYRKRGYSSYLLNAAINEALVLGCEKIWSIPRKAALKSYEAVGFSRCSNWTDEGMEFGPNCYVQKILTK